MLSEKKLKISSLLLLGIFAITGCSSSDKPATSFYGSTSDPDFLLVQSEVSDVVDSTINFLLSGFESIAVTPSAEQYLLDSLTEQDTDVNVNYGPGDGDSVTVSYIYSNDWHILTFVSVISDHAIFFNDSIQYRDINGTPQQDSDNIDQLLYKHKWSSDANDQSVTHTDMNGSYDYVVTNLSTSRATFNGTIGWGASRTVVTADSTVTVGIVASASIIAVEVEKTGSGWATGCPSSGSMVIDVQMTYAKDNDAPVVTDWTITISFNEGVVSSTVRRGDILWSYSNDVCSTVNQ